MLEKKLGKIKSVSIGHYGYQDAQIGISFDLGSDGWGTGDFWGWWSGKRPEHAKWTEDDRIKSLGETMLRIDKLLTEAKVRCIEDLVGIPVEIEFENLTRKSWRVLTECV